MFCELVLGHSSEHEKQLVISWPVIYSSLHRTDESQKRTKQLSAVEAAWLIRTSIHIGSLTNKFQLSS